MPVLRNRFASVRAGGPRQFAELQDRMLMSVEDRDAINEVRSELDNLGLTSESLDNVPVVAAESQDKIEDVLDRLTERRSNAQDIRDGIEEIQNVREEEDGIIDVSTATVAATRELINELSGLPRVNIAEFVRTEADFGPENLRVSPGEMDGVDEFAAADAEGNMQQLYETLGLPDAWETTRGENAIVAIFDTGFSEDLIDSSRIVDSFHAGGTDSPWAPSEGHGTMCMGASAANSDEGVPFDGTAPDAGVIPVRITDSEGQIRTDIISKAWDWLINLDTDRPIVANHSYGTPLCSGRPRQKYCGTPVNDVISVATSTPQITAVYAAGNEAMQCGHRPSGLTNAITGTNSIQEVITVGALLTNGREAQRYSSHGRGDCAPVADPKPNVSCALPMVMYYGGSDGYRLKDMSTGIAGSSGGTSHASPSTAGMIALLQSKAVSDAEENGTTATSRDDRGAMNTEEIKQIIHDTAEQPRRTQINMFGLALSKKGYDARFGHGQIKVTKALNEV